MDQSTTFQTCYSSSNRSCLQRCTLEDLKDIWNEPPIRVPSFDDVTEALVRGCDFTSYPLWPHYLFPLPYVKTQEVKEPFPPFTIQGCLEILIEEDEVEVKLWGYRLGYAVRLFLELTPCQMEEIIGPSNMKQISGPNQTEGILGPSLRERRVWIQALLQLFDRVLSLHGVEQDKNARDICKRGLEKLDVGGWADGTKWAVNKYIFEVKEEDGENVGGTEEERRKILPGWEPKHNGEEKSRFCQGILDAEERIKKHNEERLDDLDGTNTSEEWLAKLTEKLRSR